MDVRMDRRFAELRPALALAAEGYDGSVAAERVVAPRQVPRGSESSCRSCEPPQLDRIGFVGAAELAESPNVAYSLPPKPRKRFPFVAGRRRHLAGSAEMPDRNSHNDSGRHFVDCPMCSTTMHRCWRRMSTRRPIVELVPAVKMPAQELGRSTGSHRIAAVTAVLAAQTVRTLSEPALLLRLRLVPPRIDRFEGHIDCWVGCKNSLIAGRAENFGRLQPADWSGVPPQLLGLLEEALAPVWASAKRHSPTVEPQTVAAALPVVMPLGVPPGNVEVAAPSFPLLLDHCPHLNHPSSR